MKLTFYKVDLLDRDNLKMSLRVMLIHAVIHFAGLKAVGESVNIPCSTFHNNVFRDT